ncbi:type VI secretion system protein [Serratia marcescens]|uniref:type VI secretion system protein n=1 Tax=Serratia marcescens TaxID=615 RepID=UPI0002B86852|nr:type VI secretion system protein [Serratia marcescens]EMF07037.1 hypothetical protein F518_04213 [Serratia marcescens VGH107]
MFKKLTYFTCLLLVLSLSLVFCFTLGLWQNWSTLTIFLFWLLKLLLVTLLWFAIHALTDIIKEKKGRRWLKKYRLSPREYVLLNHWRRGASVIMRIRHQRKQLPWYLLVGNRCGKSTLLASTGLPRFDGDCDDSVAGPTQTLRWWFFHQLCVLDLSSNFLNGTATFRQAWNKLTCWCVRMPPPAGVIIALPVSALMSDDINALHTLTRQLRVLIEPLVRRFGERLPLYVMITQCDHFPGFSLWQRQLSPAQRHQPLGYSWPTPPYIDGQDELALQPLFAALKKYMSRVRLSMGHPVALSAQESTRLLDFPEAFSTLEPKLRYALASLCEPNAYFSHVRLNSVWFCATEAQIDNSHRRVSVFVHDLLTRHLRYLSLSQLNQRWYQHPRTGLAVLATCMMWLVISASLSFSRLRPDVVQLPPDELAIFLMQDEHYLPTALHYFPFQSLLDEQHQQVEHQLAHVPSVPRRAKVTFMDFQRQVLTAKPLQQRELILQLTHAVLIWQQMRDGMSLEALTQDTPVAIELQQRSYPDTLSPLAVMALERYHMQRPDGERWLQAARRLLSTLVNHDPSLNWLIAPATILPDLQAAAFWPSLPETITLPGVWTHAGNIALNSWMEQIERAIGLPQPVFKQTWLNDPAQRQNAWKQFLIDVTASLSSVPPAILPRAQLIALGQNQSPAMQFVDRTLDELKDIPATQAQLWLTTLRQLQQLAINGPRSPLQIHATQMDNQMRQSLTAWLQGTSPDPHSNRASPAEPVWHQWQNARSNAVKEAVALGKPAEQLTRGLFGPTQGMGERNPLAGLLPALAMLQERLSPQNNEASIAAVWLLYKDDARRLLGNAMAQSACWLNNQWKSTVIGSLDRDRDQHNHEEQQAHGQLLVSAFLRNQAKTLLTIDSNGPVQADYAGMKVPLSDTFIHFIRQTFSPEILQDIPQRVSIRDNDKRVSLQAQLAMLTQEQSELEKKNWKIRMTSQPATVPGGSRIMPTGTQLTLNCLKGEQKMNSMNFAETQDFSWQPGQCSNMSLTVMFPDFTASYQLSGDDVWPGFVNHFTDGEMLFDSSDFGDSAELLQQLGVRQILVRFSISSPQYLNTAWQNWRALTDKINEINEQIANLDERANAPHLHPISNLPADIAQCY